MPNILDPITSFFGSLTALLLAIGALLQLLREMSVLRKPKKSVSAEEQEGTTDKSKSKSAKSSSVKIWAVITAALFGLSVLFMVGWLGATTDVPVAAKMKNETLTEEAWKHFEKGEDAVFAGEPSEKALQDALRVAQMCVNEFGDDARDEQEKLIEEKVPLPKVRYEDEKEKKAVLERGVLNDVGTCYFIIGKSWEYLAEADETEDLEKTEKIKAAYQEASKLKQAATWEPDGEFFWFPYKKAIQGLKRIEERASKK